MEPLFINQCCKQVGVVAPQEVLPPVFEIIQEDQADMMKIQGLGKQGQVAFPV